MQVSFLIRTLNEADALGRVLEIIRNQSGKHEVEVVIVDSGSTDETLAIAEQYCCRIITIAQDEWSWGVSLNYGFHNASADYVVVLSAHCFITSDNFLNNLEQMIREYPEAAAFYGKQMPLKYYNPFEEYEWRTLFPDKTIEMKSEAEICTATSNAFCSVRKSIWESCHYDEKVSFAEDKLWARKVIKKYPLVYTEKLAVYHSHPFDPQFIYRRCYWSNMEILKLSNGMDDSLKLRLKSLSIFYRPYRFLLDLKRTVLYFAFVRKRYPFIRLQTVYYCTRIMGIAAVNAFFDLRKNTMNEFGYWNNSMPDTAKKYAVKLQPVADLLHKYRKQTGA